MSGVDRAAPGARVRRSRCPGSGGARLTGVTVTAIGHSSLARAQPGTLAPWTVSAFRLKAEATSARAPGRRAEWTVAGEHERPVVCAERTVAAEHERPVVAQREVAGRATVTALASSNIGIATPACEWRMGRASGFQLDRR